MTFGSFSRAAWTSAAAIVAIATAAHADPIPSQPAGAPIVGTWRIDPARTRLNMNGPDKPFPPRDPTFTWIFAPDGDHLRMRAYARFPQPAPSRTVPMYADGKAYPCETQVSCWNSAAPLTGARETIAYWQITPYMYARVTNEDDRVMECVTLAVSSDGKILTAISWHPETPYFQNIQIFNRIG